MSVQSREEVVGDDELVGRLRDPPLAGVVEDKPEVVGPDLVRTVERAVRLQAADLGGAQDRARHTARVRLGGDVGAAVRVDDQFAGLGPPGSRRLRRQIKAGGGVIDLEGGDGPEEAVDDVGWRRPLGWWQSRHLGVGGPVLEEAVLRFDDPVYGDSRASGQDSDGQGR
ncbi:MAG: hypothetical protein LBI84_00995 [Propionibacteriaceae bacterium]|nr:hypothetical protein [Propionibacteriaceae bacterium]